MEKHDGRDKRDKCARRNEMRQNVNWQSDGGGEQSKSGVTAGEKKSQSVRQARDERERREREWVFVKASNKASQGRRRKNMRQEEEQGKLGSAQRESSGAEKANFCNPLNASPIA